MTTMTIKEIENADVFGNAHQDLDLWSKLDTIILDESLPLELRATASRKVDDIVGEDDMIGMSDEQRVKEHAKILKDNA